MMIVNNVISYKPIKEKAVYNVWVSGLFDTGEYRVNLREEYDEHTTEIFDVNLNRPADRRRLENYLISLSARVKIKRVLFGDCGCIGNNHYTLEKYKRLNFGMKSMAFLKDLNISILN